MKYNEMSKSNSLNSMEGATIQQAKKENSEDYIPRTIPEWKIKGNLELKIEDQFSPSISKLSEEDFRTVQFYCPCEGRSYVYTEGSVFNQLNDLREGVCLLSADCIKDLLSFSNEFPENWKDRNIQLWGSVYRDDTGRIHIKYLYYDDENELWLVGDMRFKGSSMSTESTKEKSIKELLPPMIHPEDKWYIPYIDKGKPNQSE